jgi:uncharacterized BrkB/YihY/UPF0761 family membrane protein
MKNTTSSLLINWAALMALTLVLAVAGEVVGSTRPGAIGICVIACVAALKARIVLRSYLGLFRAPGALGGFSSAVFVLLALVAVSFLIFPTPARTSDAPAAFAPTFAGGNE